MWAQLEASPGATLEKHREMWEREHGVRARRAGFGGYDEPGDTQAPRVDLQMDLQKRRWEPPPSETSRREASAESR